ncbi:hypothetical protein GOP47_0014955 [Adiantum capillus-veneris]|uniref:Ubiquitin-like domain-containing protein n=1 Tax=Adiantum capillus-veneris TaxID=13818 RepID=A0A9D4ZE00_ADICA|nr:hypothetical protein GOP47_0014955 [Adiantum capillus-veneris]
MQAWSQAKMAFTVAVEVEHLPTASIFPTLQQSAAFQRHTLLIPNVNPHATVKSSLKKFIRENLAIADDLQSLTAPLFSLLRDEDSVEDIYGRYCCHADADSPDVHVNEESFAFFARERGQVVKLSDDDRLDQCHIIDECKLQLKRLPQKLSEQGGRIFVETKDGILPILGIQPHTPVSQIKKVLETMTGVRVSQQLLSSVGRVMHDEFLVEDFEGVHAIYEDSVLDLCKSGDTNAEQAHRRMAVQIRIDGGESDFPLVVQGRDSIRSVLQTVEAQTGYAHWQQRVMFSGRALDEKKTISDYFLYPECILEVNVFKSSKAASRIEDCGLQNLAELALDPEGKPMARKLKLVRTLRGIVVGTLTIPVLTTNNIADLRKKIKRSLQPLIERNLSIRSPVKEKKHIDITPRSSPATPNVSMRSPALTNVTVRSPAPTSGNMRSPSKTMSVRALFPHA